MQQLPGRQTISIHKYVYDLICSIWNPDSNKINCNCKHTQEKPNLRGLARLHMDFGREENQIHY